MLLSFTSHQVVQFLRKGQGGEESSTNFVCARGYQCKHISVKQWPAYNTCHRCWPLSSIVADEVRYAESC